MKIETIDSATLVSCIQTQQIKMDEFTKHKGELHNGNNNCTSLNQIKNFTNGCAADIRKRKFGDENLVINDSNGTHEIEEKTLIVSPIIEQDGTEVEVADEEKVYKWDIVWVNVILLGLLHLFACYGFYLRLITENLMSIPSTLTKILAIFASIGITGGAHRLWTHKSYKANVPLQCILMFMATLTYQNSVYIWARDHRLHHKCSETDGDPHNAKRGFFFSHVGWLLVRKHPEVMVQGKLIDMSDLEANPIVMFQHKYYYPLVFLCAICLPVGIGTYYQIPWEETFFICVCYKYVVSVNLTWCINSLAHLYGQKPYDKNIGPTESQIMRYMGFGEGFHNYHHTFPWDYKAAEFGNDVRNITTGFIDFFGWLGWATDRRVASQELIEKRCERTGGPGREYHMMKNNPDKTFHNIASLLVVAFYIYII